MRGAAPNKQPSSVAPPARPWLRRVVTGLGALYLVALWLDGVGVRVLDDLLPPSARLFVQVSELFPNASPEAIEWRARAWRCDLGRYEELDVRPFFPIRSDDKESRFDRALFFYHRNGKVTAALDDYLTSTNNRVHPDARIGGVMLLSLRVPIPPLGEPGPRHERLPIADYPPTVSRNYWYTTGVEARRQRCEEGAGQ
ncbi:MAG TPA: hypothetical protein VK989_18945 [Polyangia bacterium]|jgi:hypothetical protein|nr:hypothetical protein [Polyangia bacterium]